MNPLWFTWADALFTVHPAVIVVLLALFLVPLMRLITFPVSVKRRASILVSGVFGRWERLVGWIRDYIAPIYLAGAMGWNIYQSHFFPAACALILFAINEAHRRWKRTSIRRLTEFARRNPDTDPQEFFDYFFTAGYRWEFDRGNQSLHRIAFLAVSGQTLG